MTGMIAIVIKILAEDYKGGVIDIAKYATGFVYPVCSSQ